MNLLTLRERIPPEWHIEFLLWPFFCSGLMMGWSQKKTNCQKNFHNLLIARICVMRGGPKNSWNCEKNAFKIVVQDWNFSPLQSTPPSDWTQRTPRCSHRWKHGLKSSMGMLSRANISLNPCDVSKIPPFRLKTKWWLCPTSLIAWPWSLRPYFFVPRDESDIWKAGVLPVLQSFKENHWRPLTAFLLKILNDVSSSGSNAGIPTTSHRVSALKGTKVSHLYNYFK